jgi:hypothetical protein
MASRRKERPLVSDGRDGRDYAAFMAGLLNGTVVATKLVDTTVPDGTRQVTVQQSAANGDPLPDVVITVPQRRLIKLEYDDPNG